MVLKELILTADPAEWINLINFKKLNHSSSINFTCPENKQYFVMLQNSSIFLSIFKFLGGNLLDFFLVRFLLLLGFRVEFK